MAMLLAAALTPALPAQVVNAADDCGTGYHKQSDGYLSASRSASRDGRTAKASFTGKIRYCTFERLGLDQLNRRVVVSLPQYIVGIGNFSGANQVRICLVMTITANAKNISQGTSIGISGITPGASISYGSKSATIKMETCASSATIRKLVIQSARTKLTVPACGLPCFGDPAFTSVRVSTTTTMTYRSGTTQTKVYVTASDTDVPN